MMILSLACSALVPRIHTRGQGSYAVERRLSLVPKSQTAIRDLRHEKDQSTQVSVLV